MASIYVDLNGLVSAGVSDVSAAAPLVSSGGTEPEISVDPAGALTIGTLTLSVGPLQLKSLTTTQRDALTAANGMLIYNSTDSKFQGYEGGAWVDLV